MSWESWLAFTIASTVLVVIPGPTILTVISYSIAHGRRANLPLVAAVALGDTTALILSLAGVGALLAISSAWFVVVKIMGGLYLLYLGLKLLSTRAKAAQASTTPPLISINKLFFNTWLVTALNPKGIVFFVAFLPQFLNMNQAVTPQLWIMSATFVFIATTNAFVYAIFANYARSLLSTPKAQRRFNVAGGTLLSVAGLWALFSKREILD